MSQTSFTGERLHAGDNLFQVDLARHRAAYRFALERAADAHVLDMGCGSGYGAVELAKMAPSVVGLDRVSPDSSARKGGVRYVRGDLNGVPLADASFDLVVSFQVIEHLEDPNRYLTAIARVMRPNGTALITTPNLLTSDRENPYHVHEYEPEELGECLRGHFEEVELLGVSASPKVSPYFEARLRRIRRITRLDPLGLRRRLPAWLVERLFAAFALLVRRGIRQSDAMPEASWKDFPIGPADAACIDLLAVCRRPRPVR